MVKQSRRIETKTSRTAEYTCLSRAISYYEKDPHFKSNDYIATKLLPTFIKILIKVGVFRNLFSRRVAPKGIYEYVIARTKFIDEVFLKAMSSGVEQVVIFGAGFDSRGIRLIHNQDVAKIYELDVPITQNAKMKQLKKRGIAIPSNLIYVPIDFNKESLLEKLKSHGFQVQKKTLYILEGVLMYLNPEAVDATLKMIRESAGPGSETIFDYVLQDVIESKNTRYGGEEILENVQNAGETWTFGIAEGQLPQFLEQRSFKLIQHLNSGDLEQLFFTDERGNKTGQINDTHRIVLAQQQ